MDASETEFRRRLGEDMAELRKRSDVSQTDVGRVVGWSKTTISKIELGHYNISLYSYLLLMRSQRDSAPAHPGVQLARCLLRDLPKPTERHRPR